MTAPTISVVIATFGDRDRWETLAFERAIPSVTRQSYGAAEVIYHHDETLHEARNHGADQATGEWLCFLDADDELDERYLASMAACANQLEPGDWLIQPATIGVVDGREDPFPVVIPPKPLIDGNFMVIGTLVRRTQFLRVGGFHNWPYAEDWDLWLRCWIAGAEVAVCSGAIYRVHVNPTGRNNGARDVQLRTYNAIRSTHLRAATARGRT